MRSSRVVTLVLALLVSSSLAALAPGAGATTPTTTRTAGGVTYDWNDKASWGAQGEGTSVFEYFTMPANATAFAGFVNWTTATTTLQLYVHDQNATVRCSSTASSGTSEACHATRAPTAADERWALEVHSYQNLVGSNGPLSEAFHAAMSISWLPLPVVGGGGNSTDLLPPVPAGHARATFAGPVGVDPLRKTGEPGIDVATDGTVYVNAPYGPQSALWRSTDHGASYQYVPIHGTGGATTPASLATNEFPSGGGDSDFAAWGTQDLYFADLWGCNSVSSSHDGGATWITNPVSCDVPLTSDRQWLALDGPQTVYLAFNSFRGLTVERSTDGGITWLPSYISEDSCFRGNAAVGPEHNVYVAGCNGSGPGLATSTDGGVTFTWHNVAPTSTCPCNIFDVVTVDSAGNVYVVWSDADSGSLDVWMASSRDAGATWSQPVKVNGLPGSHVLPWTVAGAAGELDVVWYGTTQVASDPGAVAGDWYVHFARTTDALDAAPVFTESLVSTTPVQHGGICVHGTGCSSGRNLLDFFQVALDPTTGLARVAYGDGRAGGSASSTLIMTAAQTS